MRPKRPPLPMFLGLAVLTVAAHALTGIVHLAVHVILGTPMTGQGWALFLLAQLAPFGGALLLLRNVTRPGAALLAVGSALALWAQFQIHYVIDAPDHIAYAPLGAGGMTFQMTAFMLLVFDIMGMAVGGMLLVKPEKRAEPVEETGPASASSAPNEGALEKEPDERQPPG